MQKKPDPKGERHNFTLLEIHAEILDFMEENLRYGPNKSQFVREAIVEQFNKELKEKPELKLKWEKRKKNKENVLSFPKAEES